MSAFPEKIDLKLKHGFRMLKNSYADPDPDVAYVCVHVCLQRGRHFCLWSRPWGGLDKQRIAETDLEEGD